MRLWVSGSGIFFTTIKYRAYTIPIVLSFSVSVVQDCHQKFSGAFDLLLIFLWALVPALTHNTIPNNALLASLDMEYCSFFLLVCLNTLINLYSFFQLPKIPPRLRWATVVTTLYVIRFSSLLLSFLFLLLLLLLLLLLPLLTPQISAPQQYKELTLQSLKTMLQRQRKVYESLCVEYSKATSEKLEKEASSINSFR